MPVDADAAAVDLADAQVDELERATGHAALLDRPVKQPYRVSLSRRCGFFRHGFDGTERGNVTDERSHLTERFEAHRNHLRAVAYRMLGSLSEAEDAVQESWLRVSRADTSHVENLGGWLTTVVAHVCLDMLRARKSKREESLREEARPLANQRGAVDPEQEALMADSVGLALLVVLETLAPAERLAFVLHDLFGMSFDDIAPIVGRSPLAARQLASRARRRVHTAPAAARPDLARQREVVEAFLAAARGGEFQALLALLDPEVVRRADAAVLPAGAPRELRGAEAVARGALAGSQRAGAVPLALALVNGNVGVVVAPRGRLSMAITFAIRNDRIVEMDVIADPTRLLQLRVALLEDSAPRS
jgi:RNA polymerase sigma-70 factor (ECF subfamily)